MNTSATNRRVGALMKSIGDGTLIPQPEFQRRLVWSNRHKNAFLRTVLDDFPFPEIYIAVGNLDSDTGATTELLVDGQQRLTTLLEYFKGYSTLKLEKDIKPYKDLDREEQIRFLQYEVVVRDLGHLTMDEIKEIFQRINSTNYALNAMETNNARYDGPLKKLADEVSTDPFFENYRVFRANEIRRMNDVRFVLSYIITVMSTYFHRNEEIEIYLDRYNDDFDEEITIRNDIKRTFDFLERCKIDDILKSLGKAALFTLLVEIHKALSERNLNEQDVGSYLRDFYNLVDKADEDDEGEIADYYRATRQASNDRNSRIIRGKIVQKAIRGEYQKS